MAKVLIIGAGASHGHGVEGVSKPPLANGFFNMPGRSHFENNYIDLFNYVQKAFNVDLHREPSVDIEQLFERIESGWTLSGYDFESAKSKFGMAIACLNPIDMLCSYVVDVIYSSTKWIRENECPFHSKIAKQWLDDGDTIVSFNYDLIIDISLKKSGLWDEQRGYGFNDEKIIDTDSEILLLKPHGSLNWFLQHKSNTNLLYNFLDQNEHLSDDNSKSERIIRVMPLMKALLGYSLVIEESEAIAGVSQKIVTPIKQADSGSGGASVKRLLYFWKPVLETFKSPFLSTIGLLPMVVFPTPYKYLGNMVQSGLRHVWHHIRKRMVECDEVSAIGFSFRDVHFNQLVREVSVDRDCPLSIKYWSKNESDFLTVSQSISSRKINVEHCWGWLKDFTSTI